MVMPILSASISWLREKVASVSREPARVDWLASGSERTSVATRSTMSACSTTFARCDRVVEEHMRHLVREHGGELGGFVGERDQPARDVEIAAGQREGVGDRRIQDGDLVAPRGVVGGGDEPRDDAGDRLLDRRVGIDAAIFGDDARVLARADRLLGGARRGARRDDGDRLHALGSPARELAAGEEQRRPGGPRANRCMGPEMRTSRGKIKALSRCFVGAASKDFELHRRAERPASARPSLPGTRARGLFVPASAARTASPPKSSRSSAAISAVTSSLHRDPKFR